MKRILLAVLALMGGCAATSLGPGATDQSAVMQETAPLTRESLEVIALDDRVLNVRVSRPEGLAPVPMLVVIGGSGCGGSSEFDGFFSHQDAATPFARVVVEKYGVSADDQTGGACSKDYFRYYTIDKRVEDHLRVIQHLRARAKWWNGELYVAGWSDGGDIAARLVSYSPYVKRALLGAMGGGYTMAEHFTDVWVCASMEGDERSQCEDQLAVMFRDMADNPRWDKTEFGDDNSYRAWASRLDARLSNTLADVQSPFLIVQGELDIAGTPVVSARRLVELLEADGQAPFEYWEIRGMEHSVMSLPPERQEAVLKAMMAWLFEEPIDDAFLSDNVLAMPTTAP